MPSPNASPLVAVLLRVAYHAPKPWFFRAGLEKTPQNEEMIATMVELLDLLHAEGLVEKVAAVTPEQGPGVVLTPKGRSVAMDPVAKERLAAGHALDANDAGSQVRASIRTSLTPWLTRALVAANLVLFGLGFWWAWQAQFGTVYAMGSPRDALTLQRYNHLLHQLGSMNGRDLLDGEWWRMFSSAFLHFGLLHLAMNMFSMWSIGSFVERIFGRGRMLAISVVSVWGCACLAMAQTPGKTLEGTDFMTSSMGASGLVCGLVGAMGAWTLLAGRHLPTAMASSLRTNLLVNAVMMGVISLLPGVSFWGHLGGAIGGAAAATALYLGRFAHPVGRVVAMLAIPALLYGGWWYLQHERETNRDWAAIESRRFVRDVNGRVRDDSAAAQKAYEPMDELFSRHVARRDEKRVAESIAGMKEPLAKLEALAERLQHSWPYRSKAAQEATKVAQVYVGARVAYYREAVRALEMGDKWTRADDKAHTAMWDKVARGRKDWDKEIKELKGKR